MPDRQVKRENLDDYIEEVARRILGSPVEAESTAETLRFGKGRGSTSVEIAGPKKKGTWYDHLTCEGGGVFQLIMLKAGVAPDRVYDWLRDELGIEVERERPSRRFVCDYIYTDEAGNPLSKKLRFEPKDFSWQRFDPTTRQFVGGKGCLNSVRRVVYRLQPITNAPADQPVIVTEGEKDADNGSLMGLLTTCNPDGGSKTKSGKPGKWRPEFSESLRGRNVFIVPDNDEVGTSHARTVGNALARAECQVRIIALPSEVKDLSDWIAKGGTRGAFDALMTEAPAFVPDPEPEPEPQSEYRKRKRDDDGPSLTRNDGSPEIQIGGGRLPQNVDESEVHLAARDPHVFKRGEFLVRPGRTIVDISHGRKIEAPQLVRIGITHMRERLTRVIDYQKYNLKQREWVSTDCPADIAAALLERRGWERIPYIRGIINAPTLREDGTLLDKPGYDPYLCVLYEPSDDEFAEWVLQKDPTMDIVRDALSVLIDLVSEFPFIDKAGNDMTGKPSAERSVALSHMLTAIIRRSLKRAPLHGFDATAPGSGKSLLVDTSAMIATGHECPVISQGGTEEETEKRLGACLLAGDTMVSFDNCGKPLGGDVLNQALTQSLLKVRILGTSNQPSLPSDALYSATGNNLAFTGDMGRRTLLARLDPRMERPETRTFKTENPVERVRKERAMYVTAVLIILRAYEVAGRPGRLPPVGSYEDWSDRVRSALVWLDQPDPWETVERVRATDQERQKLLSVHNHWDAAIGGGEVTSKRVIEIAVQVGGTGFVWPDFREALLTVAGDGGHINSMRLGRWLGRNKGRVADGMRIEEAEMLRGDNQWRLVRV